MNSRIILLTILIIHAVSYCMASTYPARNDTLILSNEERGMLVRIPEGSAIKCVLNNGTVIKGAMTRVNEDSILVNNRLMAWEEVKTLVYHHPRRRNGRIWGTIGIIAGLFMGVVMPIIGLILYNQDFECDMDDIASFIVCFFLGIFFLAFLAALPIAIATSLVLGIGLFVLGTWPYRRGRHRLSKGYKKRIGRWRSK